MKTLLSIFALLVLLTVTAAPALAADPVEIPQLDMTFEAPEGWYVITRDIKADDPFLELVNWNQQQTVEFLESINAYASMIQPDFITEIVITGEFNSEIFTLKNMSAKELQDIADEMLEDSTPSYDFLKKDNEEAEEDAVELDYTFSEVYDHADIPFIHLKGTVTEEGVESDLIQYLTVNNGYIIFLTIHGLDGRTLSDADEIIIQPVVDALHFTQVLDDPNPDDDSGAPVAVFSGAAAIIAATAVARHKKRKKAKEEATRQAAVHQQINDAYNSDNQTPLM